MIGIALGRRRNTKSLEKSTVGPSVGILIDGTIQQHWPSTSLLGTFALMALQDLSSPNTIHICQHCQSLYVTTTYQTQYCSDKCRNTAQKQRYRAREKNAESKIRSEVFCDSQAPDGIAACLSKRRS